MRRSGIMVDRSCLRVGASRKIDPRQEETRGFRRLGRREARANAPVPREHGSSLRPSFPSDDDPALSGPDSLDRNPIELDRGKSDALTDGLRVLAEDLDEAAGGVRGGADA